MIRRLLFLQSFSCLSLTALVVAFAISGAAVRAQEIESTVSETPLATPVDVQAEKTTSLPDPERNLSNEVEAKQDAGSTITEKDRVGKIDIQAEVITGRPDRELNLKNEAQVNRGDMQVHSDQLHYDIVADKIDAIGNVEINRAGDHYTGPELHLKMDTGVGYIDSPVYKLMRKNAHGSAKRINFESQEEVTIYDGIYTTCEGPDPDWYLKSSKLSLDSAREVGVASNAVLVFKGLPIIGTPYISFPASEQRASGFLTPTVASSTNGGLEVIIPYYFDIAPNRDLTLFSHYIARRGLQLGMDARYMGEGFKGETRGEIINDESLNGQLRYALRSVHEQELDSGIVLSSNLNFASDNNYPKDFPLSHTLSRTLGSPRLLLRDLQMSYQGDGWNGAVRASDYQVLQDPNVAAKIAQPYARLPQITYSLYGFSDQGFGAAFCVGFGGIDAIDPEIKRVVDNIN